MTKEQIEQKALELYPPIWVKVHRGGGAKIDMMHSSRIQFIYEAEKKIMQAENERLKRLLETELRLRAFYNARRSGVSHDEAFSWEDSMWLQFAKDNNIQIDSHE